MFRRVLCFAVAAFVIGLMGCDKGPVSTNTGMPISGSQGVDKKGKPTRTVDATLTEPGK